VAIKSTLEIFLERAKKAHGEKYDYSKVIYNGVNDKVIIICSEHGDFNLRPKAHYDDQRGCPTCDKSGKSGFSNTSQWIIKAKYLYLIEVITDNEKFLKFGVTVNGVKKRLQKGQFPYNYNILFERLISNGEHANMIESKLKSKYPKISYNTSLPFRGNTECLDYGIKEHIIEDLNRLIALLN
jgi:hypothetical protein